MEATHEGKNRNRIYCPNCGTEWYVDDDGEYINDEYADEDDDEDENLSAYDAALIWKSHGKDEDYMFGYSEEELENAL